MKILNLRSLVFLLLLFPTWSSGQSGDLAKNFRNPPPEYSLLPFWSWNGTLKPGKLTWQIDQMMDKGIYGAFLHARAGLDESETPYFSERFWNAVDTTIRYSASKGFYTYLYDEDKWPSGSAGGRTIAANPPEFVKKILYYSKMEVVGPQTITLHLQNEPMAIFAAPVTENGRYISTSQVDLTSKKEATWKVPQGCWAIVSFAMAKDPANQIDYLDSSAVARFIEITHDEYFKRFGDFFGNTIPGIFFDEIYANSSKMENNIFWTDDFLMNFRKMKGYDLSDKLPLIIFNDPGQSETVRYDYFDVVKDLYVKAWFKQYAGWCAAHKIWATGHTTEKLLHYKRQSDYFSTMGQLQVPGTDNEEYRYGYPRFIDWYNTKQISSIAHLYGRKRVMAETMGGGGYTIPLEEYRYGFSMLGVYGINLFIPHLFHYTMETPESQSDWPPSWFFTNPYWKYFKPLANFGKRISYMISQGTEVCDVAILYPLTDLWEGGYPDYIDDTFYKEVQQELLDNHINYNIIDPASLSGSAITGNTLTAGSGKYRVLVLPEIRAVSRGVMEKISAFIEQGGIVISLKSLPALSENGPAGDEWVAAKIKDLFGMHPSELRPEEYHQQNPEKTEYFTVKTNKTEGAAYFTRFLRQLPVIINSRINPDLEVKSENARFLRFNHHHVDSIETYLLVNDRNSAEKYQISLRNVGKPSLWNPENGDEYPFGNYRVKEGRLELNLDFKPRESYFLVLKPEPLHQVTVEAHERQFTKKWQINAGLPPIALTGDWQFQLVPHALDYTWSSTVLSDTVSLPVMKFKAEKTKNEGLKSGWKSGKMDDREWKTVKINDIFSQKPGVQRYLSGWDGWWISFYDYSVHLPPISGGTRTFRKVIDLNVPVKEAKMAITADQSYELLLNGHLAGSDNDWKTAEVFDISGFLKQGNNTFEVRTTNTRGLLLQGFIRLKNGKNIAIKSDESWEVSAGNTEWQPSFLFANPPMGFWGNIANPLQKMHYPHTVWYRQLLPPGVVAIKKPVIKGNYSLYVNGDRLNTDPSAEVIDFRSLLEKAGNIIALSVSATDCTCGLIQPLELVCGKVNQPLVPWNDIGLEWYSGRALYTKVVEITPDYLQEGTKLVLNLGQTNYFAEIWVNDKLVTFCPWAPYEADITGFVKASDNKISLVVANLLANQATWNILDDNITDKAARWWHQGSIQREKDKLISGLLGPVQIIPFTKDSVTLNFQ